MRRRVALVVFAVAAAPAVAAEYPTKPVRIIAPFSAGGSVDLVARLLETDLGKPLGVQIVVDNRGGASGNIGTELAKNAAPDGYTLLVNTLPFVTNQFVYDRMPYDPINDFAPISLLCSVSSVLLSHPSVPVNSVKDLIALARSKPDALTYATAGPASNPHIAGELLKNMAKIKLLPVHYKGGGPSTISTLSGETQLRFSNGVPQALPHMLAKRMRGLAVTSAARSADAPQLPTIAETVPGYEFTTWLVLAAPATTPASIVAMLSEKARTALNTPDALKRWQQGHGLEVIASTPEEMTAHLKKEIAKWRVVFKEQGIKAD
jgi:tripartite-type tricarboxylate transporter receptor subunit TctC